MFSYGIFNSPEIGTDLINLIFISLVIIFAWNTIKKRIKYFSTYRWEKMKTNIHDLFYKLTAGIGIFIVCLILLAFLAIIIVPILILYLCKKISKIELYDMAQFVVIILGIMAGMFLLATSPFHKSARKAWKFVKQIFLGEIVEIYGLVLTIKEYDKPVFYFQPSNEANIIPSKDDFITFKYCIVKILDSSFSPEPIDVKIDMPLNELKKIALNLNIFSKCKIRCKRWWNIGDHIFAKEILFTKQLQTHRYEQFEMVT